MGPIPLIAIAASILLLSSAASAFNITVLLNRFSDYGNFNQYLTQTHLAGEINSRTSITVLAVKDGSLSGLSDKPTDMVKKILSSHVVLDYYDKSKLQKMKEKSVILTTLYQSSGNANNRQGFLHVSKTSDGIIFGSAVRGAHRDSKFVKMVAAQPYNISVIEVSSVIVAPGLDGSALPPEAELDPPAPSPKKGKKGPKGPKEAAVEAPEESENYSPPESPNEPPAPSPAPTKSKAPSADGDDKESAPAPASAASRAAVSLLAAALGGLAWSL